MSAVLADWSILPKETFLKFISAIKKPADAGFLSGLLLITDLPIPHWHYGKRCL